MVATLALIEDLWLERLEDGTGRVALDRQKAVTRMRVSRSLVPAAVGMALWWQAASALASCAPPQPEAVR